MTEFKTSDRNDQINDAELDAVVGGALDSCLPGNPIPTAVGFPELPFKDLFAKHTLGTYH
jgi:hypothetical protein